MISEFILDVVFSIVSRILVLLPDVSWSVDSTFFDYLVSFIRCAGYLLPWQTVTAILGLVLDLAIFRIIIAILKTIWDVLPLV